ncbi:MAG: glycosyl transferase [Pseudorhodoplanes sp.]
MLSVIIPTENAERALVPTLAMLVPGAAAGVVREVVLADAESSDQTGEVGDIAGCRIVASRQPVGARLRSAALSARSPWLMFLRPGTVLDPDWSDEVMRFIDHAGRAGREAAVFRPTPRIQARYPGLQEMAALLRLSLGGRLHPDHGLVIASELYRALGGHCDNSADAESVLLRRIGRGRITVLRSAAKRVAVNYPPT